MKKSSLIVLTIFSLFQLVSCTKNNESVVNVSIVENVSTSENKISENSEININTNSTDENISSIEIIEDYYKPNINLNKKELVLTLNKSEYLTVNFPTDYNNNSSLGKMFFIDSFVKVLFSSSIYIVFCFNEPTFSFNRKCKKELESQIKLFKYCNFFRFKCSINSL